MPIIYCPDCDERIIDNVCACTTPRIIEATITIIVDPDTEAIDVRDAQNYLGTVAGDAADRFDFAPRTASLRSYPGYAIGVSTTYKAGT